MNDTQSRTVNLVTVGVLNRSSLSKADWQPMIGLINTQCARDFGPAWGLYWACAEAEDEEAFEKYRIRILLTDKIDDPGALGYHTTSADGSITGIVGVAPVLNANGVPLLDPSSPQRPSVLSCFSHELLEMAVDAPCNRFRAGPEVQQGALYAEEVCDAVESLQYTIEYNGVSGAVSDFVLQDFWNPNVATGTQVDFMGQCPGPFKLTPGGYMSVMSPDFSYHQIYGDTRRPWKESGEVTSLRSRRRAAHVAALAARAKR